jgi:subtilisin family serine protease
MARRLGLFLGSIFVALLAAGPVLAQGGPSGHLDRGLEQLEQGGLVLPGNRPLPARQAPRDLRRGAAASPAARDYVEPAEFGVLLEFDGTRAELEAAGIRVGTQAGSVFTARVRRDEIRKLRGVAGVRKVQLARYLRPDLNVSAVEVRANLEHAASGSPPVYAGRAGAGIIVGDVDSGIDFTSPDFRGSDGKTRILYIWDQNVAGTAPSGFTYGTEWTKSQIDNTPAAVTHQDTDGHGTNVAGVLVGNGSATGCSQAAYRYVGMAPEAEFIEVATDFSDAGIIDGVNYIFQKAAALGKNAVVNLSLGSQAGPHDGSDAFTSSIGALTGAGQIVVASAGNDQEDNIHARLTTTSTTVGTDKFTFTIPTYSYNSGTLNDYVLIAGWYDPAASVVIQLKGPGAADTLTCGYTSYRSRSSGTTGSTMYIANMNSAQGFGGTSTARQFEIEIYDASSSQRPRAGTWTVNVIPNGSASLGARVDAWIYAAQLGAAGVLPAMVTNKDLTTVVGDPGNGTNIIAVGAYSTKAVWYSCGSSATYTFSPAPALNAIASFSSAGPRRDGVLKPEITAPGFGVATTHSSFAGALAGTGWDVDDGVHEIQAGTSFSAPHVAGAAALYLQAHPGATPAQVRTALESTARTDAYTGTVPNATWGYGKLDVYGLFDHALPVVTVGYPNGGEVLVGGTSANLTWTATDNVGVTSVDVLLSRDGAGGTYQTIASGVANTGSYAWAVTLPASENCWLRVVARDGAGNTGSDVSDELFAIVEPAVPTLMTEFVAEPVASGIELRWAFSDPAAFSSVRLERAPAVAGPWMVLDAEVRVEDGVNVALDASAQSGTTYWYRISAVSEGAGLTFGPIEATAGERITAFALSRPAPNPTPGRMRVEFAVPHEAAVELGLYDMQGRRVATLAEGTLSAGRHQAVWNGVAAGRPAPAGIYFLRLRAPGTVLSRRLVVTR